MTLRLVQPGEKAPPNNEVAVDPALPDRRVRRLLLLGVIGVLTALGGTMLALSLYVGKQAEGFELTLQLGKRVTHVSGTNVTLSEGSEESKCVLSLLDFRALREHARPLLDATTLENAKGAGVFTLSMSSDDAAVVHSGALPKEQLEPIDAFVIQHASACIKTVASELPRPIP